MNKIHGIEIVIRSHGMEPNDRFEQRVVTWSEFLATDGKALTARTREAVESFCAAMAATKSAPLR